MLLQSGQTYLYRLICLEQNDLPINLKLAALCVFIIKDDSSIANVEGHFEQFCNKKYNAP